jgi:hypothetical protein
MQGKEGDEGERESISFINIILILIATRPELSKDQSAKEVQEQEVKTDPTFKTNSSRIKEISLQLYTCPADSCLDTKKQRDQTPELGQDPPLLLLSFAHQRFPTHSDSTAPLFH